MIKTINLSANVEQAVEVTGGVHARFENMGDGTVYVSKSANVTAGGDGVIAVPSGATKYMKNVAVYGEYDGEYGYQGTVYVKADTSCKVEIETGDYFFKSVNTGKGGAVSGKFVKIKGRVNTIDDLPLIADEGDLYFVGAESDEDSDEYVYTADEKWELIGNTGVDLSGYVKTSDMADKYGIETDTVPTINNRLVDVENYVTAFDVIKVNGGGANGAVTTFSMPSDWMAALIMIFREQHMSPAIIVFDRKYVSVIKSSSEQNIIITSEEYGTLKITNNTNYAVIIFARRII